MYDETIAQKIINYIQENKVSTTEIGDCLGKTGAIFGLLPLNRGHFSVGKIHYVYAHSNTNWPIHEQIIDIPEDRILFVDQINVQERALFGELVATYIIQKLKARAIISKGLLRDARELIQRDFPIWCTGITPEGCFNVKREETPDVKMIVKRNKEYYQDAIAVCDDCGVVIIPKEQINEEMLEKIIAMEEQERIWFHCVLDLGWNTFDTVCAKKYLNDESIIQRKKDKK